MSFFLPSITGLAAREDWPENVSLPWSSFQPTPKVPYERVIPEIEDKAKDLLEVRKIESRVVKLL